MGSILLRAGSSYSGLGGTIHIVEDIKIHPAYRRSTNDYDVSLIKVVEKFQYGSAIQPISIASTPAKVGDPLIVTGWGALVVSSSIT